MNPTCLLIPLLLACGPKSDELESLPEASGEPEPATGQAGTTAGRRLPVSGLHSLACTSQACLVLDDEGLRSLDPTTLALSPVPSPELEGTPLGLLAQGETIQLVATCGDPVGLCLAQAWPTPGPVGEAVALDPPVDFSNPVALRTAWNDMREQAWRVPFAPRTPTRDGGTLAFLRGREGTGQLIATGPSPTMVQVPGLPATAALPRWLAMHPTGAEAFLLAWPRDTLSSYDPDALTERWRLRLVGSSLGLFVTSSGRWLVLAEGGSPDPERILDYDERPPAWPAGWDPTGDLALSLQERPPTSSVVVVDLAGPRVMLRVPGAYRAFVELDDHTLIVATDKELARLEVAPPAP